MTDSAANNDPATNPTGGSEVHIDVDMLLADAASLAAEVSRDLGADQLMVPATEDTPDDLDSHLERVDQLLAETVEDLGQQTDPETPGDEAPSPDPIGPDQIDSLADAVGEGVGNGQAAPTDPATDADSVLDLWKRTVTSLIPHGGDELLPTYLCRIRTLGG